jgi:hypothetical protein
MPVHSEAVGAIANRPNRRNPANLPDRASLYPSSSKPVDRPDWRATGNLKTYTPRSEAPMGSSDAMVTFLENAHAMVPD